MIVCKTLNSKLSTYLPLGFLSPDNGGIEGGYKTIESERGLFNQITIIRKA